jgi:hypothetical protein
VPLRPAATSSSLWDAFRRFTLDRPALVAAALLVLVATSLVLRVSDLGTWLWMDEGISVGIASHPLGDIPQILRQDGSPPLYYLVLHGWMSVFGWSETATHALSLVLSVAAIPVALWAGWSLFGRRTGWVLAVLVATSPFLSYFATETRMYALVALLALLSTAAFLHVFAFRRRRYLWLFVPTLALVLYTHNWGLWLAAAMALTAVGCALAASGRRQVLVDAALAFGAVALSYLPWVPTLVYQAGHTGAPWSPRPLPREAVSVVADLLGDPHERVLVALLLVAAPALWTVLRRRGPLAVAVLAAAGTAVATVALGWVAAQLNPSWASRYLVVCAPAVLLVSAVGLVQAGLRGVAALALILAIWTQPLARLAGLRPEASREGKAAQKSVAEATAGDFDRGDLVIVMQMEEVPVLAYYLGLRFATAMGEVKDPSVPDWRDALDRMRESTVETSLRPLLDSAATSTRVALVCARPGTGPVELPWFALMEERCGQWRAGMEEDRRFTSLGTAPVRGSADEQQRLIVRFVKTEA